MSMELLAQIPWETVLSVAATVAATGYGAFKRSEWYRENVNTRTRIAERIVLAAVRHVYHEFVKKVKDRKPKLDYDDVAEARERARNIIRHHATTTYRDVLAPPKTVQRKARKSDPVLNMIDDDVMLNAYIDDAVQEVKHKRKL